MPNEKQRFKALLKELGLSRKELAKELNMGPRTIDNGLSGNTKLPRWAKSMLLTKKLMK